MGQRCNLVLLRNGNPEIYYDHWAANRLDNILFWGPESALTFIENSTPEKRGLLDDACGEGGIVMDLSKKHLLWFGGEDIMYDIIYKRIYMSYMRRNWPGWTMAWAFEGMSNIAEAVSVDRSDVETTTYDDWDDIGLYYGDEDYRHEGQVILTVKTDTLLATRLNGDIECLGQQSASDLLALVKDRPVPLAGQPLRAGVHLDINTNRLSLWTAGVVFGALKSIASGWPGWTLEFWGDDIQKHKDLAPGLHWPAVTPAQRLDVLKAIEKGLSHEGGNLALEMVQKMAAEGQKDIKLNPATFHTQTTKTEAWKVELIERLIAELKEP